MENLPDLEIYLNLPNDALYHVCEQMDIETLDNMSKAHGRFYQICSPILWDRLVEESIDLFELLEGCWYRYIINETDMHIAFVDIRITNHGYVVVTNATNPSIPKILDNMKGKSDNESYSSVFHVTDIFRLRELSTNLRSQKFSKIDGKAIHGLKFPEGDINIILPKKMYKDFAKDLGEFNTELPFEDWIKEAQEYTFQMLEIEPNPDFNIRRNQLIDKLTKTGQIITCTM